MKQLPTTHLFRHILHGGIALLLLLAVPTSQAQMSETFSYQGYLLDTDGTPVSGALDLSFTLYDAATGGTVLWQEAQNAVSVAEGIFTVQLGSDVSFEGLRFDGPLWLGVQIDGAAELTPRLALSATPYALGVRGLRIVPASDPTREGPSVIGGWSGNTVSPGIQGATIAGGGDPEYAGRSLPNQVTAPYGTVGGGARNTAGGTWATVPGGRENTAGGEYATVAGGFGNTSGNRGAVVPGGAFNQARAPFSFAAGINARAAHDGAFVWSDNSQPFSDSLVSTAAHQFLIRAIGGVGIGTNAPSSPLTVAGVIESTTGGFRFPDGTVQTTASSGGGSGWQLGGNSGTTASSDFIGTTDAEPLELRVGGVRVMRYEPETATAGPNVIGGWSGNSVAEGVVGATIAGGGRQGTTGQGSNHVRAVYGTVGGGEGNDVDGVYATISGGSGNTADGVYATVSGGAENTVSGGIGVTISGGGFNMASGRGATVGGGETNTVRGGGATVPGGGFNHARGAYSFAAGYFARAAHDGTFVWNDRGRPADSLVSTGENQFLIRARGGVGIGTNAPQAQLHVTNTVNGTNLLLAGSNTNDDGTITSDPALQSSDLVLRSNDAIALHLDHDGSGEEADFQIKDKDGQVIFNVDESGEVSVRGTVVHSSDRNRKERIEAVDAGEVLALVSALPVYRWSYRGETVRHVGPMAQDFRSAFGLGRDERTIAAVDADGVSLAAIQALYRLAQDQQDEIAAQRARIAALEAKVDALAGQRAARH